MKKIPAFLTAIFVTLVMISGSVFGSVDPGKPMVRLVSAPTIEVVKGETTDVAIRVRNVGTADAEGFFLQIQPDTSSPFIVTPKYSSRSHEKIGPRGERELYLSITVDKDAEIKTYPITLGCSYSDMFGTVYENKETLNVKVVGSDKEPKVSLSNFTMNPGFLKPGSTAVISATYENISTIKARKVKVAVEGLSNEGVTVLEGPDYVEITEEGNYYKEKISFTLSTTQDVKAGSYPLKFVTTYTDDWGNEYKNENVYYVNVSSSGTSTGSSSLVVSNPKAASGTFGVGQNFTVSFDLKNEGIGSASSVKVTAKAVEDGAIVPTSQNIQVLRTIAAGGSNSVSFTFSATSKAVTKNYPIEISIEYFDGEVNDTTAEKITFSHYFGVNISNPDKDDEDTDETKKNVPKIIISDYSCNPTIVNAGEPFDLNMTFFNSHSAKTVKNIKASLTVTDKDKEKGASIFSPVDASNTLYVGSIAPNGSVSRTIKYYAVPDAQPQNYSIDVTFEYEDEQGNQFVSSEIVGINVSQPPKMETSQIEIPTNGSVGQPVFVNFDMYNTGKVKISNLKVVIDGDLSVDSSKTTWYGNFESGDYQNYYVAFYPNAAGQLTGKITIEYDSTTGEHYEIPHEFTMDVMEMEPMEPMPGDFDKFPPDGAGGGGISKWVFIIGGSVLAVVVIVVVVVLVLRRRRKKELEFDE